MSDPHDAPPPPVARTPSSNVSSTSAPDDASVSDDASVPTKTLATVWLTLFLDLMGFGMIIPVLPYYASEYGASPAVVALLSTSFSAAQFVMSPILGRVSDRVGRRPVMLISIAGSLCAMLVLGFAQSLWMIFLARVVSGMANANLSTAHAYVADRVPAKQRARYMGIMGAAIGLGFIFGPAIGGLLSTPGRPSLPFLVAAGLAGVNWLMAFFFLPESLPRRQRIQTSASTARGWMPLRPSALRRVWGTRLGLLILLNFAFFFAFAAMESTFALFTEARFGWGARETGYMFTGIGVVIVIVQGGVVGRLVAAVGERRTVLTGFLVLSGGLLSAGLSGSVLPLAIGGACIAAGNGLITPGINALISHTGSEDEQGLKLGLSSSAASFARIIGPVVAGLLFELQGEGMPLLMGAVATILAAGLTALRLRDNDGSV